MAVFTCKRCGGDLDVTEGVSEVKCEYCEVTQTIPHTGKNLEETFNRANKTRARCEFDKASMMYENIIMENPNESEAYWGMCLCKYGIEYVNDPVTGRKVPTCHRTEDYSILEDDNFLLAIKNADSEARKLYNEEAQEIDRLQQRIHEIVKNEKPYDVFISFKQTDADGNFTIDCERAGEIYDALTKEGLKVFFSVVTLKNKGGVEYEPYIYAALKSSKVMILVSSSMDYINAPWVANEWKRFLSFRKKDISRVLIPCYCGGMELSDYPAELRNIQAKNLDEPFVEQNLIREVLSHAKPKTVKVTAVGNASSSCESLLKRAYIFLSDKEWEKADAQCEKVLDIDPENAMAYLAKLLAKCRIPTKSDIRTSKANLEENLEFHKFMQYASNSEKEDLTGYFEQAKINFSSATYKKAEELIKRATDEPTSGGKIKQYEAAMQEFRKIRDWEDSMERHAECYNAILDIQYGDALGLMSRNTIPDFENARKIFSDIEGWKDSKDLIVKCDNGIKECIYCDAIDLINRNNIPDYEKALGLLRKIPDWKDSELRINDCNNGISNIKEGIRQTENAKMRDKINKEIVKVKETLKNEKRALRYYKSIFRFMKSLICLILLVTTFVIMITTVTNNVVNDDTMVTFMLCGFGYIALGIISICRLHDSGVFFGVFLEMITGTIYGAIASIIKLIVDIVTRHKTSKEQKKVVDQVTSELKRLEATLNKYK